MIDLHLEVGSETGLKTLSTALTAPSPATYSVSGETIRSSRPFPAISFLCKYKIWDLSAYIGTISISLKELTVCRKAVEWPGGWGE